MMRLMTALGVTLFISGNFEMHHDIARVCTGVLFSWGRPNPGLRPGRALPIEVDHRLLAVAR
jgi:hypothetical protein